MAAHQADPLDALCDAWRARWPEALAVWSRFTRLSEPRWCRTENEEALEHLTTSFAMIRFEDHAVVISLRLVRTLGLDAFPVEVMAHEIGHHVLAPGDLHDFGRMMARMRRALPSRESAASLVSNLYTDLLINDRLQRVAGLRMDEVYRTIDARSGSKLWNFYLRTYEVLWALPRGSLVTAEADSSRDFDAALAARLVRVYAKDWVSGSGRFAALCLPYLLDEPDIGDSEGIRPFRDTEGAGAGGDPSGLVEVEEDEETGARHPAEDDELTGARAADELSDEARRRHDRRDAARRPRRGGRAPSSTKPRGRVYRTPIDHRELLESLGVRLPPEVALCRYYREAAMPHLVPFPERPAPKAVDPQPEGLDVWDAGSPLDEIDWLESALVSPRVVPGMTTMRRLYGTTEGDAAAHRAMDLYLGIDCSGSMVNPAVQTSYPVLGAVIMALSALRAGARVMVTLSGEPGKFVSTPGFVTDEERILLVLTSYLGTGYTFGIRHLGDAFAKRGPSDPPAHVVIVTDWDIFAMLDGKNEDGRTGWAVASTALQAARGGGTYLLHMVGADTRAEVQHMRTDGWATYFVTNWTEVIAFARDFNRTHYVPR